MPYDELLADRIRNTFKTKRVRYEEKKMMGGLCYMVDDKMCAGIINNQLMARIHPDWYEEALRLKACREMNFTGKAMRGFVYVDAAGIDTDEELEFWIQKCLDYNPLAKSSKKKK